MVLLRRLLWLVEKLQSGAGVYEMPLSNTSLAAVFLALFATPVTAEDQIKICYRADAAPFSYLGADGNPTGYSVDLCQRAVASMNASHVMVEVSAQDRFDRLRQKDCDILCEATTASIQRRSLKSKLEFSLITFVTDSVFLYPKTLTQPESLEETVLVGLLQGTTVEDSFKDGRIEGGQGIVFEFRPQSSHEKGAKSLADGKLGAYIADREIIEQMLIDYPELQKTHTLSRESISYEPYALAVRLGDDELRIRIDEELARLYRSGEISDIIAKYIPARSVNGILGSLFELQAIPE